MFTYLGTFIIETDKTIITMVDKNPCAEPTVLNDDMLFKMIIIIIMCVQQLKLKGTKINLLLLKKVFYPLTVFK